MYTSPLIYRISLSGLKAGTRYYYCISNDWRIHLLMVPCDLRRTGHSSDDAKPLTLGLTADLGQIAISNASRTALSNLDPDVILVLGDLSYADEWHPHWDTFGLLSERLFSSVLLLMTVGNHELIAGEAFVPYNVWYPMPHHQSGSWDNTYWS